MVNQGACSRSWWYTIKPVSEARGKQPLLFGASQPGETNRTPHSFPLMLSEWETNLSIFFSPFLLKRFH